MKIVSYFLFETFLGSVEFKKFRIFCTKLCMVPYKIYETFSDTTEPWMVSYILYRTLHGSVERKKVSIYWYGTIHGSVQ